MVKYRKVKYFGLEIDDRTFLVDLENMVIEERKEKDGHWEVIDAEFNWCQENEFIFDEDHQLIRR